jgi:hypothetical protein
MQHRINFLGVAFLVLGLGAYAIAQDFHLPYFVAKASSTSNELSNKEREALLSRVGDMMDEAIRIHLRLVQTIQIGETEVRYQEGKYWMSKLEADERSIGAVLHQIKLLKEKPTNLMASVQLYKSLKDLSLNFNAYNNLPYFCALVGDLAPEMELWADPVFYKLYLLPLAQMKDLEKIPPPKARPAPKVKKP